MKKMERLVGIIYALKENKKLTAKDISDIFEVSERTIYRDIDALSQLNVPIIAFEGHGGGYEINESFFLPSLALKKNEILYLLMCIKLGGLIRVPNMKDVYESLKYKLLNMLDDQEKEKHIKLLERIEFLINRIFPSEYQENITTTILESFWRQKNLIINYYSPKKNVCEEREFTPYVLFYESGGWYIDGLCHSRNDHRIFRLDRIRNITLSEKSYQLDDIQEHINGSYEKECTKVILEMDKYLYEIVKNDDIFLDAKKENIDNKLELTLYTNRLNNIIDIAFHNYEQVKIIEPKECIDELKKRCHRILDKY